MVVVIIKDHPEIKISTLAFGNHFRGFDLIEEPVAEDLKGIKKGMVVKSTTRERFTVVSSRLVPRSKAPEKRSGKKTKTLQEEIGEDEVLLDIEVTLEM